jgi:transposase
MWSAEPKSDPGDALVFANILRTDLAAHRPLPADGELVGSIRVLARAQQDAVWDRQQTANKLRSLLHEYYPTFLATFEDLASPDARLAAAPTPAAQKLRRTSLRAALVRAGRRRNIDHQGDRILTGLRGEQFTQLPLVEQAMGRQALAHLRTLNTAVTNIADLEDALGEAFAQHPDAAIITSFPGLGTVLGARILGEIGDDRTRFTDAKALKTFAGTAPVTRTSGLKRSVTMRVVRNRRLCHAGYLWALPLLVHSPGARAHYDQRASAETPAPLPPATSPTDSSGSCTTASKSASATTKPRPSHPTSRSQLDFYRTCDVSIAATTNSASMSAPGIDPQRSSPNSPAPSDRVSTADNFSCFPPTQQSPAEPGLGCDDTGAYARLSRMGVCRV